MTTTGIRNTLHLGDESRLHEILASLLIKSTKANTGIRPPCDEAIWSLEWASSINSKRADDWRIFFGADRHFGWALCGRHWAHVDDWGR